MDSIVYYRRATSDDIETLTTLRLAFLAEISGVDPSDSPLPSAISQYFTEKLPANHFIAFLALAGDQIIATSGMTYHHHPPSNKNPTGREAYIMNMYTLPEYRRHGIATRLLEMLIGEARQNHCAKISLHVLPAGRSIYTKAGFIPIDTEMRLTLTA